MKSVGEVMAIGRTFKQALWKGLRSLETGRAFASEAYDRQLIAQKLITPTPDRLNYIRFALESGYSVGAIQEMTSIDPWFLEQIAQMMDLEASLRKVTLDRFPRPKSARPNATESPTRNWRATGTPASWPFARSGSRWACA